MYMNIINKKLAMLFALLALGLPMATLAQDAAPEVTAADVMFTVNNTWMMVAIFLVFIMHLGFAMVETGLTRAKNTVNILFKNTAIVAIGLLTYTLIGFNLMYPDGAWMIPNFLGFAGFGVGNGLAFNDPALITSAYNEGYTYWTDFLFQGMFAATAATIVSGAVAERVKLGPFEIIFSL
jgi:Amt family ammonium transporter